MLSDEVIDKVVERLVNRIEQGNEYILKKIGNNIKKIGKLSTTEARQIAQILKYGGDYDKILKKLAEITELNVKDITKIFDEVAKVDYDFAKQFYNFRNIKYTPYEYNYALKKQVDSLKVIAMADYVNFSKTSAIGFSVKDINGNNIFKGLQQAYIDAIDNAVINVSQGKTTFEFEMRKMLKELGESGIKSINYESGRTMRLDSAIRMNLKSALSNLHNEIQKQFGEEFGADGVEISVHQNPAEDHEDAQGKQFRNEEWEKLQRGEEAATYQGEKVILKHSKNGSYRPISELNCYHYIFSIIVGVSEPEYSKEQLEEIKEKNNQGFDFDGKHYTMYQGTQLQRRLETEIRKQKEMQVLYRSAGQEDEAMNVQSKINKLTDKYNDLNNISGLLPKEKRMSISGYRKIKVKEE